MDAHRRANRNLWDAWAPVNARSELYPSREFRAGANRLHPLERQELADVSGRTLLHLMCHFIMDTLSGARLGAAVTGIDVSLVAIRMARELGAEMGFDAFASGPLLCGETGCYSDPDSGRAQPPHEEWAYRLGDLVTFLTEAGLRIEFLHEHPFTVYRACPFVERGADGYGRAPEGMCRVPLLFSLRAVREG